jgi:hypothetical protein
MVMMAPVRSCADGIERARLPDGDTDRRNPVGCRSAAPSAAPTPADARPGKQHIRAVMRAAEKMLFE